MRKIYITFFILTFSITRAQTPAIDTSFNSNYDTSYKQYIGEQSAQLPDGKFLSAYYSYDNGFNGTFVTKIIRITADGKIDPTFTSINTPNSYYTNIFANSDGSFIVVGVVDNVFYMKKYTVANVLDNSFTAPVFTQNVTQNYVEVKSLLFQTDGKIIVGGNFYKINNQTIGGIVRLNANGSVDNSFVEGTGVSGLVNSIVIQTDGKYMVCGNIGNYNGVEKHQILRLNSDGTLDGTFNVTYNYDNFGFFSNGFQDPITAIAVQPDGKIIVGGASFYINNLRYDGVTRLNPNGTKDTSFLCSYPSTYVYHMLLQNDGSILLKGQYAGIVKLNNNGGNDSTFTNISTSAGGVNVLAGNFYMIGNKIMVNSNYYDTNGITRQGFHRLNANGSLDFNFNPSFGFNSLYYKMNNGSNEYTTVPKVLLDGKVLVSGVFTSYNDVGFPKGMLRLNIDGTLDPTFSLGSTVGGTIEHYEGNVKQQNDGKILFLNSLIAHNNNLTYTNLVRINNDGSLDTSLNIENFNITKFQPLTDGKILVTGTGSIFQNGTKYKILRLNNNGTVDTSFSCPVYWTSVNSFELQNDDKILICGKYDTTNTTLNLLRRINADGSLDATFQLSTTYTNNVFHTKLQPDGKILINYNNSGPKKISRLNADGTIDSSFITITTGNSSNSDSREFFPVAASNTGLIYLSSNSPTNYFNSVSNNNAVLILSANGTLLNSFGNKFGYCNFQGCTHLIFRTLLENIENSNRNDLVRYKFSDEVTVDPPSGSMSQIYTAGQTLTDLLIVGQNIQWYDSQSECISNSAFKNANQTESLLPASTPLVNGTTYYASQTVNGIESAYRLPVTVSQSLTTTGFLLNDVVIYPNPTHNAITINNSTNIEAVEIYSILGQNIVSKKITESLVTIDLSTFDSGIYILKLISSNNSKTIKVIKQ